MIELSVIIVNYNTKEIILSCLNSIKKHTKNVSFEVIVVDNASTDGSLDILRKRKDIKLIRVTENLGFAKGNNLGIRVARGNYVLLLNSDTELFENSFRKMIDFLSVNNEVGIAGCSLLNKDGTKQSNGGHFPTLLKVFLWSSFLDDFPGMDFFKLYHPHVPFYEKQRELDWITGAFFMVRKEILNEAGLLNERFFMYVEELELCYRVKQCGWQVFYTPITSVTHLGGASSTPKNAILGEYKGLLLFYNLHKSFFEKLMLNLFLKLGALLRILLFGILLGRKEARSSYVQALAIN